VHSPFSTGLAVATALLATSYVSIQANAEENAVRFPSVDLLTHYTTVTRGSTVEHMLTSPEALAATKQGKSIPVGTHFVLQDFQSGELYRLLVSQKMGPNDDEWEFQWFWPTGEIKADEQTGQCYSCHRSRAETQFLFTYDDATKFGEAE
jgi:hypothetical protein